MAARPRTAGPILSWQVAEEIPDIATARAAFQQALDLFLILAEQDPDNQVVTNGRDTARRRLNAVDASVQPAARAEASGGD